MPPPPGYRFHVLSRSLVVLVGSFCTHLGWGQVTRGAYWLLFARLCISLTTAVHMCVCITHTNSRGIWLPSLVAFHREEQPAILIQTWEVSAWGSASVKPLCFSHCLTADVVSAILCLGIICWGTDRACVFISCLCVLFRCSPWRWRGCCADAAVCEAEPSACLPSSLASGTSWSVDFTLFLNLSLLSYILFALMCYALTCILFLLMCTWVQIPVEVGRGLLIPWCRSYWQPWAT